MKFISKIWICLPKNEKQCCFIFTQKFKYWILVHFYPKMKRSVVLLTLLFLQISLNVLYFVSTLSFNFGTKLFTNEQKHKQFIKSETLLLAVQQYWDQFTNQMCKRINYRTSFCLNTNETLHKGYKFFWDQAGKFNGERFLTFAIHSVNVLPALSKNILAITLKEHYINIIC